MNRVRKQQGFSLTEVLIAVGIMAIGLVMVAMVFPVGIKLTALTTERTIGAVAADEAFAKIQLYGLRDFVNWPADPNIACSDFQYVNNLVDLPSNWDEFKYPSTVTTADEPSHYHWSALCRKVAGSDKEVQVTVFVTRKIAAASKYRAWDAIADDVDATLSDWPKPVKVQIDSVVDSRTLQFLTTGPWGTETREFFDDGYTIVDNYSGRIYRVLEVDHIAGVLTLQDDWVDNGLPNETIWAVPPAVGSGRYPAVGVYQKVLRFDEIQ